MQFLELSHSLHDTPQTSVPMLMLTNLITAEEVQALVAKANAAHDNAAAAAALEQKNAAAAAALEQKKAKTVQLLRGTYQDTDYAEMKKVLELEINQCKDAACIDQIALNS